MSESSTTLQTREVVRHPGGPSFGARSTALRIGDKYWFGTDCRQITNPALRPA